MSVGPMGGVVGSAAGAPLSQTAGSETERAKKDSSASQRKVESETKAEKTAGIGETEGDQAASDRDADGRRLWEQAVDGKQDAVQAAQPEPPKPAKDPTGQSGSGLDLTG